jgi:beta-galactosidase beta subunit
VILLDDVAEARRVLGGTKKWDRLLEAIAHAETVLPDVTASIGDSLTYRVTRTPANQRLTGHRRYLDVRHVLEGSMTVAVADLADLTPVDEYSDLDDRQRLDGPAEQLELAAGAVLVVEAHEALLDVAVDGRVLVARVTVEGAFFANK